MCIVVVDDEPALLRMLQDALQDEGYRVLSFARPVYVLDLKQTSERVDLFLIDIMLPGSSGIDLAARLKDEGFETTPKIAMSASPHLLRAAEESTFFEATLEKPFDLEQMLGCIRTYTGTRGHKARPTGQTLGSALA